jgi:hypothetical protein
MTDDLGGTDQVVVNPVSQAEAPTSGKAIASLVLGILSMPSCFCVGIIAVLMGSGAIVLAMMAQKDVAAGRAGGASKGMAIAGLICGIVGVLLGLVYVVLFVIGLISGASSQGVTPYGP